MTVGEQLDLDEARRIVLDGLKSIDARVYLFGSRAKGITRRASDIDIAVESRHPGLNQLLAMIADRLEEAPIVRRVDLVDLNSASPALREAVKQEGVLWRG